MPPAEPGRGDEQAQFEAIVAQLRDEGWPASLEGAEDDRPSGEEPQETPSTYDDLIDSAPDDEEPQDEDEAPDPVAALPSQWRVPTGDSLSILDEEDFVPDDPEPLPSGDLGFWGAALCLGGGILWLLYLFFFDRYARPLWWILAVVVALTGLVLVFLRQPDRRDDDWDDDVDGAVL